MPKKIDPTRIAKLAAGADLPIGDDSGGPIQLDPREAAALENFLEFQCLPALNRLGLDEGRILSKAGQHREALNRALQKFDIDLARREGPEGPEPAHSPSPGRLGAPPRSSGPSRTE